MSKIFIAFLLISNCFLNLNNLLIPCQDPIKETPKEKADRYLKELQHYFSKGDYEMHKAYSDSLLYIAKDNGFTKMHVLALSNQAVFYNSRSERLKAIELYYEALEKCELIPEDFRSKVIVLVNMGNTYINIESYSEAIEHMENVLFLLDTNKNYDKIRAAALLGLANSHSELKNFEKSIEYASEVKTIGEKMNNNSIITSSIGSLAQSYNNTKQYNKALEYTEMAINSKLLDKPNKNKAWILLNAGKASYYLNNLDQSLIYLQQCLVLTQQKKLSEVEMYAHEFLAKLYEKKENYKASVKEQKQYSIIKDSLFKDQKAATKADLNEKIGLGNKALNTVTTKKNIAIYLGLAITVLFIGLFFMYLKRKKQSDVDQIKLRQQYVRLQRDFSDYKTEEKTVITNELTENESKLKPYKNSSLTLEKREEFKKRILIFMKEEKPFLNPEMTQKTLAGKLDISSHHFSEVLYYNMEQNFYNFVNSYRILEAQNLMKNSKYTDAKIIAIAFDSGFKSKTSFNRIFKLHTGITPSEFRNNIGLSV